MDDSKILSVLEEIRDLSKANQDRYTDYLKRTEELRQNAQGTWSSWIWYTLAIAIGVYIAHILLKVQGVL